MTSAYHCAYGEDLLALGVSMRLLERAAFLAVFVTMGKFFERELGLWPAVGLTLAVVFVSVGIYTVLYQRRA
jgi:hypothetical protein